MTKDHKPDAPETPDDGSPKDSDAFSKLRARNRWKNVRKTLFFGLPLISAALLYQVLTTNINPPPERRTDLTQFVRDVEAGKVFKVEMLSADTPTRLKRFLVTEIVSGPEPKTAATSASAAMANQQPKTPIRMDTAERETLAKNVKSGAVKTHDYLLDADISLMERVVDANVSWVNKRDEVSTGALIAGGLLNFFLSILPSFLIIGVLFYFMRRQSGGSGGLMGMGKSKAQLINPDDINVTFADVLGCDEAVSQVKDLSVFLKNPEAISRLGATVPMGVLLYGPPGTGKTLLARALAKECNVPFFAVSGSDFVEMFVGVGSKRISDMFEKARKAAPCILFIDEVESLAAKRGADVDGGASEHKSTLGKLLTEMDGLSGRPGVLVIAATNRPEILDPAFLRPDRIDRQIMVTLPDVAGREALLKLHSKKIPMAAGINFRRVAQNCSGFSGAQIKSLCNEAAIIVAKSVPNRDFVVEADLDKALSVIQMGAERPTVMTEEDRKETAFHEAGHAWVAHSVKNSDPLDKVSIMPRGRALGVTVQLPKQDRFTLKKEYMLDRMAIMMGGREAELVFCNTLTSGASNDIERATALARDMVQRFGMSRLGPVCFGSHENDYLGNQRVSHAGLSQKTLEAVDDAVRDLLTEASLKARQLILDGTPQIQKMVEVLLEKETMGAADIEAVFGPSPHTMTP